MSETTIEKNNEAENNEFQKIHKRLDEQNKKIDKILPGLFFLGILIIMFT